MRTTTVLASVLLTLTALGCASTTNTTDTGPQPADGGGVCCPLTASSGCSPRGFFGGWAATGAECREMSAFDGCPFQRTTDSHGCAVLTEPACTTPCGSVPRDVQDIADAPLADTTDDLAAMDDRATDVPTSDVPACNDSGMGACPSGLSCLCCPAGGPTQHCLCTTACTATSQCTDATRPTCNQESMASSRPGICAPAGFVCAWGAVCAAAGTLIATPSGERTIESLQVGDEVFGERDGSLAPVHVTRVSRTAVHDHTLVRAILANGRSVEMSPGHPTADGRTFGDLHSGARLDSVGLTHVAMVPYSGAFTYDILTDGRDGAYVASGVLVGSTLAPRYRRLASFP